MSCSLGVCFGWCQPLPSVFIFPLSILSSSAHSFQAFQVLICKDSFQAAHLRKKIVKSPGIWLRCCRRVLQQICVLFRFFSAPSWNYLGAKLIALDPTSRCNRLSANLGFSQYSQVSSGQPCTELSTVLVSQGLDPCRCLSGSPLPCILFPPLSLSSPIFEISGSSIYVPWIHLAFLVTLVLT